MTRKREEICITAPDEGLHFSLMPSILPLREPRTGKEEEVHLQTAETVHGGSDILRLCCLLQSSFYVLMDFYVGVLSKIFFSDKRFC